MNQDDFRKLIADSKPKSTADSSGYRDRAQERRQGKAIDYQETQKWVQSLIASNKDVSKEEKPNEEQDKSNDEQQVAMDYVEKLHGDELVFHSVWARDIYETVMQQEPFKDTKLLLPGRMSFVYNLGYYTTDVPIRQVRSKSQDEDGEESINHQMVLKKVVELLSGEKKVEPKPVIIQKVEAMPIEDDDDIFSDAGSDYKTIKTEQKPNINALESTTTMSKQRIEAMEEDLATEVVEIDSDEEPVFLPSNDNKLLSRFHFDTEEEWLKYKKKHLPSSPKKKDRNRKDKFNRSDKRKLNAELHKIEKIIEEKYSKKGKYE